MVLQRLDGGSACLRAHAPVPKAELEHCHADPRRGMIWRNAGGARRIAAPPRLGNARLDDLPTQKGAHGQG
jgi:hypothetical protein